MHVKLSHKYHTLFCLSCFIEFQGAERTKNKTKAKQRTETLQQCSQHVSSQTLSLIHTCKTFSALSICFHFWEEMSAGAPPTVICNLHIKSQTLLLEVSFKNQTCLCGATALHIISLLHCLPVLCENSTLYLCRTSPDRTSLCLSLYCTISVQKKLHVIDVCMCVQICRIYNLETCRLLPAQASRDSEFNLPRKPLPGDTVADRKPTKPYFEAHWSGDSAVFWSQLSFVCVMAISVRWKMAFWFSEQNLMAAMRMHLPNVFPSVCLRWNEACSRGLHPNN